ncbi:MAG TPA: PspC domain-containing protein [Puia sp.]|jgi:phage shock protein PspC (stress-responsive transcriptional regulator)|nr:PspC domain-containing protein [Puia sp.]
MKKIININFHSRVIPIEESAYEILQQYIDSLRRYFAREEGRDEIISDIENRFAELFSETLKKGAPCITDADVNAVIASMGRPEEFEGEEALGAGAPDATASGASPTSQSSTAGGNPNWQYATSEHRRLYRAENDKILGGVCGGLANYLRLDPAIIRIIFVLMLFSWGFGFLLYLILWIILPTRSLPAAVRKRLYRNPDERVIAGVASGLAAYFHIEVWIPRLIFVLPLVLGIISAMIRTAWWPWHHFTGPAFFTGGFGGTLMVTYIVLWIVLPEANSASEKLEMRGEKVDLESIKNTIKSDLEGFKGRAKEMGNEMNERFQQVGKEMKQNTQSWAAEAGPAIRNTSNSFGHAIGVLFKAFFLFIAGSIAFALIMALIALIFRGEGVLHVKNYILEGFWENFLAWAAFFLFLVVPVIALLTWLIRRISGTRTRRHYLGYAFMTLWVVGLFCLIILGGMIMNNFQSRQHAEETVSIAQPARGKLIVRTNYAENRYGDTDLWFNVDWGRHSIFYILNDDSVLLRTVRVSVQKSDDSAFHVRLIKLSHGSSGLNARELASDIRFPINQSDSVLNLPAGFMITPGEKFRNQQVLVEIYVPVGRRIQLAPAVKDYNWFNIDPRRRHISWSDNKYHYEWDEDIDEGNSYSWSSDVEYIMTAGGLERTDHKAYEGHQNKDRRPDQRQNDDGDDHEDDPGYKAPAPTPAKPGGGYRYKGPGSQPEKKTSDSTPAKRTAMVNIPADCSTCLLSALGRI